MEKNFEEKVRSFVQYVTNELGGDYLIGGSLALQVCGFPVNREPKDLDIMIKLKDSEKSFLRGMAAACEEPLNYPDEDHIRISWRGLIVDIWFVETFDKKFVWKDYLKYAGVTDVLKEKYRYGRRKDVDDFIYAISVMNNYLKR